MPVYTYNGNKSLWETTSAIIVLDVNGDERYVANGKAVDVSDGVYQELRRSYYMLPGGTDMAPLRSDVLGQPGPVIPVYYDVDSASLSVSVPGPSLSFGQPVAEVQRSPAYRVPRALEIVRFVLSAATAPAGSALTVVAEVDGAAVAELSLEAGDEGPQISGVLSLVAPEGSFITVSTTAPGASPALGVRAQIDTLY